MRVAIFILLGWLACNSFYGKKPTSPKLIVPLQPDRSSDTIPPTAKRLINCYKDFAVAFAGNHLILKDGSRLLWDDGIKNKSHQLLLEKADLQDMFEQKYVTGALKSYPAYNFEPGRIRYEAFFLKMYGATEKDVRKNLTEIIWCPKLVAEKIMVTRINGIDKKLKKISAELDEHPELKKYLTHIGGTFAWRKISGTNRQSMHSFGMTIDINTVYSDYWQWNCKCTNENTPVKYKNRIPQKIVDIFEKYGFIWGGKWYHFDTMHFEYRPELIQ